ncbi:hypothetical protein Glove_341g33 [Diversispora epigaea]|uniref:HMG box domain-containing protein n=1 Tax=Diversispora epigaea TaxID=1348612 RepID=A0A397HGH7_9GLOM|nr:hypothetical protein Glove_341g33 [Diversispora epigaea]
MEKLSKPTSKASDKNSNPTKARQRKPRARKTKRTPRPPNAFILYIENINDLVFVAQNENLTNSEVSKEIRFQWEKLADRMKGRKRARNSTSCLKDDADTLAIAESVFAVEGRSNLKFNVCHIRYQQMNYQFILPLMNQNIYNLPIHFLYAPLTSILTEMIHNENLLSIDLRIIITNDNNDEQLSNFCSVDFLGRTYFHSNSAETDYI